VLLDMTLEGMLQLCARIAHHNNTCRAWRPLPSSGAQLCQWRLISDFRGCLC
jgi:hypothetical protein